MRYLSKEIRRGYKDEHLEEAEFISKNTSYHPLTPPMAICVATEYFAAMGPEFFPKRRFHHR